VLHELKMVGWTRKVAFLVGSCAWTGLSIDLSSDVDDDVYNMDNPQELQASLEQADMQAVTDAVVTEKRQTQARRLITLRQRVNAGDKKAEVELQQQARLAAADEMKELAGLDDADLATPAPAHSFAPVKHAEVAPSSHGPDDPAHFRAVSFLDSMKSRRTQLAPDASDASDTTDAAASSDAEDVAGAAAPADAPGVSDASEAPAATDAPEAPAAAEAADEPADEAPGAADASAAAAASPEPQADASDAVSLLAAKAPAGDSGSDVVSDMARRLRGFGPTAN